MSTGLPGMTIAFAVAGEGVEQVELTEPWKAMADVDPDSFDAPVLPGGVATPDAPRIGQDRGGLHQFVLRGRRAVVAICYAPWTLVEADVVCGRTLTSWPSLQTDLRNAAAEWVDEAAVQDGRLVTSGNPTICTLSPQTW